MKIKRSKRVKKRIKRRAGSLTPQQSAKKIQSAFRENTTRRKASALRQRNSAKKIQSKIHQAFDFTRDNCAVCTEKLALTSKVSTLSCKHGLHKQCLTDLKNSQAFKDKTKRRCPICRTKATELQMIDEEEDTLGETIKKIIHLILNDITYLEELRSQANIERFKQELFTECESEILLVYGRGATGEEIFTTIAEIIATIRDHFEVLNDSLSTIYNFIYTKKGVLRKRISNANLIIVQDILNTKVLISEGFLTNQLDITLPTTIATQIQVVKSLFN